MPRRIVDSSSSESEEENSKYVNSKKATSKSSKTTKKSTPKSKSAPKKGKRKNDDDSDSDDNFIDNDMSGNEDDDYTEEDDKPTATRSPAKKKTPTKKKPTPKKSAKPRGKAIKDDSSESESSSGSSSGSESGSSSYSGSSSGSGSESSSYSSGSESYSEEEEEKPTKATKTAPKARKSTKKTAKKTETKAKSTKSSKKSSKDDTKEEIGATKGSKRWETLIHNGPLFPPEYVPHGVPLVYDGEVIKLPPEIEEVASFYARYLESDHVKKPVFNKNFFKDFRNFMKETKHNDLYKKITKFELCDFGRIHSHLVEESEKRKIKTKEEKQKEKQLKEEQRLQYGIAIVNGVEQRIGNFTIEPPGLFLGRGSHPKTGMLKRRVTPEMVTINVSKGHTPKCPVPGHNWGDVICDDHVTWLANWHENIHGRNKYVWLHATSTIKGASDQHKYEVARKLKDKIDGIRKSYTKDLNSDDMLKRQRSTALWLIDNLALRVGGEKGEDEADTVGCCSLRVEHVSFPKDRPQVVCFDFLGKDSMRFQKDVEVPPAIYKNLKNFAAKPKKKDTELFDKLSTTLLNEYLKTFMDGLTAKVFRTYNASFTLQEELRKVPNGFDKMSVNDKVYFYNCANKQVAILCNHQKTVKQSVFSAAIGGLKELLIDLVKQKKMVADQIVKLGGKVPNQKSAPKPPPKKKRSKNSEKKKDNDDDDDDFESDANEGKSKKRKTPKVTKKETKKGKRMVAEEDDEDDDDFEKNNEEIEAGAEDEDLKALIQIDENDIKEDDPDIIEYRRSKEEKLKIKATRDKLIQEKESQMMKIKQEVKEEEMSDDESYKPSSKKTKVKKEPKDEDEDVDMSESKSSKKSSKKSAKVKVKKEELSSESESEDDKKKKKSSKKEKETKVKKEEKEDDGFVVPASLQACLTKYKKIEERIEKTKAKMVEKGELRNVALGTSKINYMDPRITVAWCKKVNVPLERVFQKTLREKFTWALDVEEDFVW